MPLRGGELSFDSFCVQILLDGVARHPGPSRETIRRVMFKSPMCITSMPPLGISLGEGSWVNSQWKLSAT